MATTSASKFSPYFFLKKLYLWMFFINALKVKLSKFWTADRIEPALSYKLHKDSSDY